MLFAITILKDLAPIAEQTKFDCTLLDFLGVATLDKEKWIYFIENANLKLIISNVDM